ncbi:hypothetical protein SDC9_151301 [bioreactor metagenome]|uniref:Uncharacterized protein n=1 Tax=bioreactor metagenome TaxID=1076179 RepID=A0A645EPW8_9ZZZZ
MSVEPDDFPQIILPFRIVVIEATDSRDFTRLVTQQPAGMFKGPPIAVPSAVGDHVLPGFHAQALRGFHQFAVLLRCADSVCHPIIIIRNIRALRFDRKNPDGVAVQLPDAGKLSGTGGESAPILERMPRHSGME